MAPEERRDPACHRFGVLDVQQVADTVDLAVLDLGEPGAESVGDFEPQGFGVRTPHREHGLPDGGPLVRTSTR